MLRYACVLGLYVMATESLIEDDATWHPELVYLVHRAVSAFSQLACTCYKTYIFYYQMLLRLAFRLLILLRTLWLAEKKGPGFSYQSGCNRIMKSQTKGSTYPSLQKMFEFE